jgi:site-specific DNA recombinase
MIVRWVTRVEKALLNMLYRISNSPEDLCGDDNNENNLDDKQNRLELLIKKLEGINRKIDNLLDLVGDKSIDKETFSTRYEPLTAQRDTILHEIPRLQGEIDFIIGEELGRQYVVSQANTLQGLWPELTYAARQEIIKEVVERIVVSKESLNFVIHHISSLGQKDGETLADFPLYRICCRSPVA